MPGVDRYPKAYIARCRADFAAQVRSYRDLIAAASKASGASLVRIDGAIAAFEPGYFNNLLVALDARFAQRSGDTEADLDEIGEIGNPPEEVRRICTSLMDNGGVMAASAHPGPVAGATVLGIDAGDRIALNADDFESICAAFLDAIDARFGAA
jgi:hypothetical protein